MKKITVSQIFIYILYAAFIGFIFYTFLGSAFSGRINYLYEAEVFPLYKDVNDSDDYILNDNGYLSGFVRAFNGYYDQVPFYTYKRGDELPKANSETITIEENSLEMTINFYSARFVQNKKIEEAIIMHITKLTYGGVDMMHRLRETANAYEPNELFFLHFGFSSPVVTDSKTGMDMVSNYINPLQPFIITKSSLEAKSGDGYASIINIKLYLVDEIEENYNPNFQSATLLWTADTDNNPNISQFEANDSIEILNVDNLDISFETNKIKNDNVAGLFPTETEINNYPGKLNYTPLDLTPYNRQPITITIVLSALALLATYFIFINKHVVMLVQERADKRRLEKQKQQASKISIEEELIADEVIPVEPTEEAIPEEEN